MTSTQREASVDPYADKKTKGEVGFSGLQTFEFAVELPTFLGCQTWT